MEFEPSTEPVDILLVDDTPENVLALEGILSRADYNLVQAGSGGEALKLILKHDFAVILLDVLMPGMNGFETARLVRARDRSKHIPILFLTAHGSELAQIYQGYSVGAVDYLIKPIDPDVVKAKVAVFVDLFRKTRQLERQQEQLRAAERLKSEILLRESAEQYDVTFEQAGVGILHVGLDGRLLKVNPHFSELSGYSERDALSCGLSELLHPEDAGAALAALEQLNQKGQPAISRELRLIKKDSVTRWVSFTASVTRATGAPKRYIVTAEDVTERRRAERRESFLAAASERLMSSLDYTTTLAAVAGIAVPTLADWCAVDIVREDGDIDELALSHVDPSRFEPLRELSRRLKSDPKWALLDVVKRRRPVVITNAAGSDLARHATDERTCELLAIVGFASALVVPLVARGRTLGALTFVSGSSATGYDALDLAMATDLSQRAALAIDNADLYQKSQEAIRMREEFLSIASHELRTPLTPLLMQIQSLSRHLERSPNEPVDRERLQRSLGRAERQVDRLRALVETLLDVSRLATRGLKLTLEDVDLSEMLRDVATSFAEQSARVDSPLTVSADDGVVGRWDRLRIEQVLSNLVANAIKYGAGKPISVSLEAAPGVARITVSDHGIGIPRNKLEKIFNRFERAVPTDNYGGLGLGLYVARQIAEAHGGTIAVTSEVDKGSSFVLELPLIADPSRIESDTSAELRSA
jgi:PAS domain S-box-containing protein